MPMHGPLGCDHKSGSRFPNRYPPAAMTLILNDQTPIHWAAAGAGIAAITLLLLFLANRRLGLSSGFEDVCGLILGQPYFARASLRAARGWRLPLVAGLVLGGF